MEEDASRPTGEFTASQRDAVKKSLLERQANSRKKKEKQAIEIEAEAKDVDDAETMGSGDAEGGSDDEEDDAPLRPDMIRNAVAFLTNPKVQSTPLARRIAFLEHKGLTSKEISEAVAQVGGKAEDGGSRRTTRKVRSRYEDDEDEAEEDDGIRKRVVYRDRIVNAAPPPPPPPPPPSSTWKTVLLSVAGTFGVMTLAGILVSRLANNNSGGNRSLLSNRQGGGTAGLGGGERTPQRQQQLPWERNQGPPEQRNQGERNQRPAGREGGTRSSTPGALQPLMIPGLTQEETSRGEQAVSAVDPTTPEIKEMRSQMQAIQSELKETASLVKSLATHALLQSPNASSAPSDASEFGSGSASKLSQSMSSVPWEHGRNAPHMREASPAPTTPSYNVSPASVSRYSSSTPMSSQPAVGQGRWSVAADQVSNVSPYSSTTRTRKIEEVEDEPEPGQKGASFQEVMAMVQAGKTPPDVRSDIDDRPADPESHVEKGDVTAPLKPWERRRQKKMQQTQNSNVVDVDALLGKSVIEAKKTEERKREDEEDDDISPPPGPRNSSLYRSTTPSQGQSSYKPTTPGKAVADSKMSASPAAPVSAVESLSSPYPPMQNEVAPQKQEACDRVSIDETADQ